MESHIYKAKFRHMLSGSLESASVTSKELNKKIDQIHKELSEDTRLEAEAYISGFGMKLTDFIYSTYDSVVLTKDERIVGIQGKEHTELFDATDCKPHLDL